MYLCQSSKQVFFYWFSAKSSFNYLTIFKSMFMCLNCIWNSMVPYASVGCFCVLYIFIWINCSVFLSLLSLHNPGFQCLNHYSHACPSPCHLHNSEFSWRKLKLMSQSSNNVWNRRIFVKFDMNSKKCHSWGQWLKQHVIRLTMILRINSLMKFKLTVLINAERTGDSLSYPCEMFYGNRYKNTNSLWNFIDIIMILSTIMYADTCYRYYYLESFHNFRGLPILFPGGWYFSIMF
jgi:hypothetical protein